MPGTAPTDPRTIPGGRINRSRNSCSRSIVSSTRPSARCSSARPKRLWNRILHAALRNAMARNQPAATAVHVDVGTLHYGAAIHTAWRGGYPVLMTAGTGPRAFPGSMRGARAGSIQWVQEPRDQGEIVRQYTKMDHRIEHEDNPGLMISRLPQVAMSEPRGPVYVSIPQESAMLSLPGTARFPTRDQLGRARPAWPDPADAHTIARWLV